MKREASTGLGAPAELGVQTVEDALTNLLFVLHGKKEYRVRFDGRIGRDFQGENC